MDFNLLIIIRIILAKINRLKILLQKIKGIIMVNFFKQNKIIKTIQIN